MNIRLIFYFLVLMPGVVFAQTGKLTAEDIDVIVERQMHKSGIPGLAIVIYSGGQEIYKKGFGFADVGLGKRTDVSTEFELGSNSKAFTALGILYLQSTGRLSLDDQITKYLPWFYGVYKGEKIMNLTIRQFLHQKSGIPFSSIDMIHEGKGNKEMEATVRRLSGIELDSRPGTKFEYASINYDVLGLIIEKASHRSYEEFMDHEIFERLGLERTIAGKDNANADQAKGYKWDFLKLREYQAPVFRANTPAGYITSDINDIGTWLGQNINTSGEDVFSSLIQRGHERDDSAILYGDDSFYGGGWYVNESGFKRVFHNGANPNFSSFIGFDRATRNGVAILANLNSTYTEKLGGYILDRLEGIQDPFPRVEDLYKNADFLSFLVMVFSVLLILAVLIFVSTRSIQLMRDKIKLSPKGVLKKPGEFVMSIMLILFIGFGLYSIPNILYNNVSWRFLEVWSPFSLTVTAKTLYGAIILFFAYFISTNLLNKNMGDHLFSMVILSMFSGLGNALVIFSINSALRGMEHSWSRFAIYFLLGLSLYLLTQRIIRMRLISVSNNNIYEKRGEISRILLMAPYEELENMSQGEITAVLNNDAITISRLPNVLVGFISSLVTIIFCLIYLGFINIYAFLGSLLVFGTAVTLYVRVNKAAKKFWERNRTIQSKYIQFVNDLVRGVKELKISQKRGADFMKDMDRNSDEFRQTNTVGSVKFANTFIVGELLFTLVIGSVVFLLPIYLVNSGPEDIIKFVFVFLYITGPVNSILHSFPDLLQIRISFRRINKLKETVLKHWNENQSEMSAIPDGADFELMELKNVEYEYANQETDSKFSIGPVSCRFKPGEISFIVGGNGSGKSTLAKLLSGLYVPSNGVILMNGRKIEKEYLSQYYSVIFSDYYLFDKLYGIDSKVQKEQIDEKLVMLKLSGKVGVKDGMFSTMKLSSGQRKRLALLISYLDDKSICLFDEWASDQDPEFRKFFYEILLTDLKRLNKCIIVATHDERYFGLADKIIKLELGKVVEVIHAGNPVFEL